MVIVAVVLLLLGPDKLPEVAHKLGAGWRSLKRLQERVESEVREAIPDLPSPSDIARIARSPVNLLNSLADRVDAAETATNVQPVIDPALLDTPPVANPPVSKPQPRIEGSTAPPDPSMN